MKIKNENPAETENKPPQEPPYINQTDNLPIRERKYFLRPGVKKKWREFDITRGGICALITVVEKGIQISSKPRKLKNLQTQEKRTLMNQKLLNSIDEERSQNSFDSSDRENSCNTAVKAKKIVNVKFELSEAKYDEISTKPGQAVSGDGVPSDRVGCVQSNTSMSGVGVEGGLGSEMARYGHDPGMQVELVNTNMPGVGREMTGSGALP